MTRNAILLVGAVLLGACGGRDFDKVCADYCASIAERAGLDPSSVSAGYCPQFCGREDACRCMKAVDVGPGESVCTKAAGIICPDES